MTWTPETSGTEWTEETWLALEGTSQRIELFDGVLHVSSAASLSHQRISRQLASCFDVGAEAAGLEVLLTIGVRLRPNRICVPDLVIIGQTDVQVIVPAAATRLICEVVSPGNPAADRVMKMHYYAEAAIPWYLLVEQKPELTLYLLRLESGSYVEHAVGRRGAPLRVTDPVKVEIDPADIRT